jgi:hypothetical protein
MGEFCLWHGPFTGILPPTFVRVDSYLSGGYQPSYNNDRLNTQGTFDIQIQDKSYSDILEIKTGDDFIVTVDSTGALIKDDLAGKCHEYSNVPGATEAPDSSGVCRKQLIYSLTVEQRDFSGIPFTLDKTAPIMLSDLLPLIFQDFTRWDLGGIIGGIVVPKYILLTDDFELLNYSFTGITKEHLIESVNNRCGKKWYIRAFSEPSETYGLRYCYQVVIYD